MGEGGAAAGEEQSKRGGEEKTGRETAHEGPGHRVRGRRCLFRRKCLQGREEWGVGSRNQMGEAVIFCGIACGIAECGVTWVRWPFRAGRLWTIMRGCALMGEDLRVFRNDVASPS